MNGMTDTTFNTKLLKMQGRLLNFALILTSDRDQAYHLLQDSTLSALDHAGEYDSSTSFDNWMKGVMRKVYAAHYAEDAGARPRVRVRFNADAAAEIPEGAGAPEHISGRLALLAEPQRSIVSLWITGYTIEDITVKLGVDSRTVIVAVRSFRV